MYIPLRSLWLTTEYCPEKDVGNPERTLASIHTQFPGLERVYETGIEGDFLAGTCVGILSAKP